MAKANATQSPGFEVNTKDNHMKNTRWTLLAALLMAAPHAANAQAPGAPGTPGAATTAPADPGAVNNSVVTTDTTTATTTTGIAPDSVEVTPLEGEGTLANTGGAPILMSLSGLALAAAAFGVRRRIGS